MNKKVGRFLAGFIVLFFLYHGAEWFVVKRYNPSLFVLFQFLFFIAAFLLARWQGFKGLSAWALKPTRGWWLQWLAGMLAGMVLYGISFYVSTVVNGNVPLHLPAPGTFLKPLLLFAFGTFLSSLSEDILTRGYLFRHIRPKVPSGLFIAFSAIIYLLNHIYRLGDGFETILYILLLGVLFAVPLIYSERLWYTTGMHWMGNLTFYFTQQVIQVPDNEIVISPNTIFIICILFMLPVQYLLFPRLSFMRSTDSIVIEALKQKIM